MLSLLLPKRKRNLPLKLLMLLAMELLMLFSVVILLGLCKVIWTSVRELLNRSVEILLKKLGMKALMLNSDLFVIKITLLCNLNM